MSDNFPSLIKQYHAFYEVSPYYLVLEERPVGLPAKTRRVQAGFNVDLYGVRQEDNEPALPPPHDYAVGYAELQEIAERVSQHATDCCTLEVIPFPSTAIIDSRHRGQVEAMIRIRISHSPCSDPAGPAEQRALDEVEKELRSRGVTRR